MADIKMSGSGQMFKNPFLERLTKTHISIPLTLFYGTAIAAIIYTIIYTEEQGVVLSKYRVEEHKKYWD